MQKQNNAKIPLVVICGPTAAGKTKLAVDLALRLGGEVVSADSMQVYRHMNIGTAKPTEAEMRGIPHHLLDIVDPTDSFSLADYTARAVKSIQDISSRGKLSILAGGTGLYISSLIDNIQLDETPTDPTLRAKLGQEAQEMGTQHLWNRLQSHDPELAEKLHPNNQGRVIRALEVFLLTGTPMSHLQKRSRLAPSPYEVCMLGLTFEDRDTLYRHINFRVDEMITQGLIDEAKGLVDQGLLSKTAAQAIGYKELFSYLDGNTSKEAAIEEIKLQSRRYAKRQLTWLRRDKRIHWLTWEQYSSYAMLLDHAADIVSKNLPGQS